MGVDLKSCGWETPFLEGSAEVELPEQLTKKWWEKNKQAVAKNSVTGLGKTGVTEALKALGETFDKMKKKGWPRVSSNKNLMGPQISTIQDLINGAELKDFSNQLLTIETKAKEQAEIALKGKFTEKTGKVLLQISGAAKELRASVATTVLRGALAEAKKAAEEKAEKKSETSGKKEGFDGPGLLKLVQERVNGVGKDMKSVNDHLVILNKNFTKETKHTFAINFASVCRNLTQGMRNAAKCNELMGDKLSGFQPNAVKTLAQKVIPYANDTNGGFVDQLDQEGVTQLANTYKTWALEFVKLLKPLKL